MDEIRFSVELRDDEQRGPGRLVSGRLIRYNERAKDRPELFEPDSLCAGRKTESYSIANTSDAPRF